MNLKRGFRRVFIIATGLWTFACLIVLPFELRQAASDRFSSRDQMCMAEEYSPATEKIRQDCIASTMRDWQDEIQKDSYPRFYKENWKMLVILVLGGPLLVYLVALAVTWMYRGFRTA